MDDAQSAAEHAVYAAIEKTAQEVLAPKEEGGPEPGARVGHIETLARSYALVRWGNQGGDYELTREAHDRIERSSDDHYEGKTEHHDHPHPPGRGGTGFGSDPGPPRDSG